MPKTKKKFSTWNPPLYRFAGNCIDIDLPVRWQGSEAATTNQAKRLSQTIWWYCVNPHLTDSLDALYRAGLPRESVLALVRYVVANPVTEAERSAMQCFLYDGNGEVIADARAGRSDLANLTAADIPVIAKQAGRRA